jgi:phospholipase C
MPSVGDSVAVIAVVTRLPNPTPPPKPEKLFQEPGMRRSRALPYELHVHAGSESRGGKLILTFRNTGQVGTVFHVYDRLHLDRIPRRYTVEAGKSLADEWGLEADGGRYDLWIYGPNGFVREFRGALTRDHASLPDVQLEYDVPNIAIRFVVKNGGSSEAMLTLRANAYRDDGPWQIPVQPGGHAMHSATLVASHRWYDFTVTSEHFERRFAGRLETGAPGYSDPAV